MICPNCGAPISGTADRCVVCGASLPVAGVPQATQARDTEARASRPQPSRVFRWANVVAVLGLLAAIAALAYFVYALDQRVGELESNVSSQASELYTVGRLARNANNYAHSHYSDARLKNKVAVYPGDSRTIMGLRPVTFEWDRDGDPGLALPEGQRLGLIAQEVEQLFPELVSTDGVGYKVIDYDGLTAVLVDALQSQQAEIDLLNQSIAALRARLSELESGRTASGR